MQRPRHFQIRDGAEFDQLIPKATGQTRTIARDADLGKTLEVLPEVVGKYQGQMKKVARRLQGKSRRECARNIWEFCYYYFQYHRDEEGTEQIRTPARSWADRYEGIDCDCFTVLISSLLLNMRDPPTGQRGIPHAMRVTKYHNAYDPDPPFSHIYVVVPDEGRTLIIDPVVDRFNYEVPYTENIDLDMKLQVLNGPPGIDQIDLGLGMPRGGTKFNRLHQQAAESGMTVEEVIEQNRRKFEQEHGKTVDQFEREVRDKIAQGQAESRRREEEAIAKLRAELAARGVEFSESDSREDLLNKIRASTHASAGSGVANRINKKNPIAVKLRNDLIAGLRKNSLNVAAKLHFALYARHKALSAGISDDDYDKIKKGWTKLKEIFFHAGGTADELVAAIREGIGSPAGTLDGLGLVDQGAKMLSGAAAITLVAALLKSVKVPSPEQARQAGISVPSQFPSVGGGEMITATVGDEGATIEIPNDMPPKKRKKWLKWVIGGGVLLVGGGGYAIYRSQKKTKAKPKRNASKSGNLSGTRSRKTAGKRQPVRRVRIK